MIPGWGRSPEEGNGNPLHTLAWKITWMEKPGKLQSMGHKELDTTERLHFHFLLTIASQVPLDMGFSMQEYWSRLSCPPEYKKGYKSPITEVFRVWALDWLVCV